MSPSRPTVTGSFMAGPVRGLGAAEKATLPRSPVPGQSMPPPNPELIHQHITGHWGTVALATAVQYSIFTRIESGVDDPATLAGAAGISGRGTQALLDGLVGMGLLTVSDGHYVNTPEASFYLVKGRPAYVGGWTGRILGGDGELASWTQLPAVVRRGRPDPTPETTDSEALLLALAGQAWPVARQAADRLDFGHQSEPRLLVLAGGAGAYSAVFLRANRKARARQVDAAGVNRVARDYVARFGVLDRFEATDGDFREVDLGSGTHDVAVFAHLAALHGAEDNLASFRRLRQAVKQGGALVIVDFMVNEDRSGPPFALLFHLQMLLRTRKGAAWRESDYRGWLREAGFGSVTLETTTTAAAMIIAR
jgi:O-methyltransferase/methyltransferase family protein